MGIYEQLLLWQMLGPTHTQYHALTFLEVPFSAASCQILHVFSSTSRPGGRTIGKAMMATPTFGRMCWPSRNSLTSPNSRIRKVVGSQKCQERVNNGKNQKGWNQVFPLVSIRRPYNLSIINIRCLWRLISKARCGRSWVTSIGGRNVYQPRSSILLWKVVDLSASIK